MGKSTYAIRGGSSKRTCTFDGGGGQTSAILVRTYKLNDPDVRTK